MTDFKDNERGEGVPARAHSSPSGFGWLTVGLSTAGTLLIIAMAVGVNADILGRELINRPVPGVTEFLGLAIVAVVFLQIADTSREERHISNDLIVSWIAERHPRLAYAIYGIFHLIGAAMFLIIVWFVVPIFTENYQGGYYKGTAGYIQIPVWPFVGTVLIGAAAAAVQYVLLALREFGRAKGTPDV